MYPEIPHGKYAGNEGDVVKHVALLAGLRECVNAGERFSYAETHAGPPFHLRSAAMRGHQKVAAIQRSTLPSSLNRYLRYVENGQGLNGSSVQVRYACNEWHAPLMQYLFDFDPYVVAMLKAAGLNATEGEGYLGVMGLLDRVPLDFVLIDPFDIPSALGERYQRCIAKLTAREVSFLSWQPKTPAGPVFPTNPEPCMAHVSWGASGCYLTFSRDIAGMVNVALRDLSSVLGWTVNAEEPGRSP
jgi:23S rRNA A2030 N6-methylase RlmJ